MTGGTSGLRSRWGFNGGLAENRQALIPPAPLACFVHLQFKTKKTLWIILLENFSNGTGIFAKLYLLFSHLQHWKKADCSIFTTSSSSTLTQPINFLLQTIASIPFSVLLLLHWPTILLFQIIPSYSFSVLLSAKQIFSFFLFQHRSFSL